MTCQCYRTVVFLVIATLKTHKKEDNKAQMINVNVSMSVCQLHILHNKDTPVYESL